MPAEPHLLQATFTQAGTFHAATLSPGAASVKENLFLILMLLAQEGTPFPSPSERPSHSRLYP